MMGKDWQKLIFVSSLFVILQVSNLFAYPWPFKQMTTNQQKIRQTVGAYRATNRFHNGIDVVPADSSDLRVYAILKANITSIWSSGLRLGNFVYEHISVDSSIIERAAEEGFPFEVEQGTLIGEIVFSAGTDHLHFIEGPAGGTKTNPLNSLSTFNDSTKPTVDSFKIFKENQSTEITSDIIYGKIDLRVKGYDKMDSGMGTSDHSGKVMPYKLGYKIIDKTSNVAKYDRFTTNPTIRFVNVPPNTNVRYIHEGITSIDPEYWVTNESLDGAIPTNKYWNAKQKKGADYNIDAKINSEIESQTPDGKYKVQVLLGDNRNNINVINNNSEKIRIIDNFRPYVKKVSIGNKYQAEWIFNENNLNFNNSINESLSGGTYTVTIVFSEPVANSTLSIDTFNSISLSSFEPESDKKTFVGTLDIPSDDSSHNGKRTMTIFAQDLAGTNLVPFSDPKKISVNPATEVISGSGFSRDSNGNHVGSGGNDTLHQFKIEFPPTVDSPIVAWPTVPKEGARNVNKNTDILVYFSKKMDESIAPEVFFKISPAVSGEFSWSEWEVNDSTGSILTFNPNDDLEKDIYTVTINSEAKDLAGQGLDGDKDGKTGPDYKWVFEINDILIKGKVSYTSYPSFILWIVPYANPAWSVEHPQEFDGRAICSGCHPYSRERAKEEWRANNSCEVNSSLEVEIKNYPVEEGTVIDFNPELLGAGGGANIIFFNGKSEFSASYTIKNSYGRIASGKLYYYMGGEYKE